MNSVTFSLIISLIRRCPVPVQNLSTFRSLFYFYLSILLFYQQDAAKLQTAPGIKFTHRSKINIFAPQRRLVAPIHVKFGMPVTDGNKGPLGRARFHANRYSRMGTRPTKWQKFPFFGKESHHMVEPFDFYNCYGLLYAHLA